MRAFFFTLILIFPLYLSAQNGASNVRHELLEESESILIQYDLTPFDGTFTIYLKTILDGQEIEATSLKGDVGENISGGRNKKIYWNYGSDYPSLQGNIEFEVTGVGASRNSILKREICGNGIDDDGNGYIDKNDPCSDCYKCKISGAVWAGLGGVATTGVTLLATGFSAKKESNEIYDIYKVTTNPNDLVYDEITRQEHYDSANEKHKRSQYLKGGGAAVIVIGGIILIRRIRSIKQVCVNRRIDCLKEKKKNLGFRVEPLMDFDQNTGTSHVGIAVKF